MRMMVVVLPPPKDTCGKYSLFENSDVGTKHNAINKRYRLKVSLLFSEQLIACDYTLRRGDANLLYQKPVALPASDNPSVKRRNISEIEAFCRMGKETILSR